VRKDQSHAEKTREKKFTVATAAKRMVHGPEIDVARRVPDQAARRQRRPENRVGKAGESPTREETDVQHPPPAGRHTSALNGKKSRPLFPRTP